MIEKKDIRDISHEELEKWVYLSGDSKFRGKQIFDWIWKAGIRSFDDMTNVSKALREKLKESYDFNSVEIYKTEESSDKTIKIGFRLWDGQKIEGVLIPSRDRVTACISTQSGCRIGCKFCATGTIQNGRNLTVGEMFDEVIILNQLSEKNFGHKLSNYVLMGMGEPLLNYENVISFLRKVTDMDLLGISPSRITLSTVGISKNIVRFAKENINVQLAVSLHTADDLKRNNLIPYSKQDSLEKLSEALEFYHKTTGNRITIEYLLLDKFNSSNEDAAKLARFCKKFPVKINLIEYNNTSNSGFSKVSDDNLTTFSEYLKSKNMVVNIRRSRGGDINAACGQLAANS